MRHFQKVCCAGKCRQLANGRPHHAMFNGRTQHSMFTGCTQHSMFTRQIILNFQVNGVSCNLETAVDGTFLQHRFSMSDFIEFHTFFVIAVGGSLTIAHLQCLN